MKGKASGYGVSGSGEYTRTDYQEHRKDTAMTGGVIIAVLVVIVAAVYLLWQKINPVTAVSNALSGTQQAAVAAVVQGGQNLTPVLDAKSINGQYYPVKPLTQKDYDAMLTGAGAALSALVQTGNAVVPPGILETQANLGATGAKTVNTLGLNNAYVALPTVQKGLVTLGEQIGLNLGFDPIQAGYDFRANIVASNAGQPEDANQWLRW
jgi:hypothetical protein